MITEENITKLYDGLIAKEILTTKELKDYGFSSNDLTKLVDMATLTRVKRGSYTVASANILFSYGKQLLAQKEFSKAIACFEKIQQLEPTNINAYYYVFLNYIIQGNYTRALEYFEKFYNIDEPPLTPDNNLYLYLLAMITDLPEKYQNYVKNLTLADIMLDMNENSSEEVKQANKARTQIFRQDFSSELLDYFGTVEGEINNLIIRRLLYIVSNKRKKDNKTLIKMLEEENYEWIINYFIAKEKIYQLTNYDSYCLYLTKKLVKITKTHIIPLKEIYTGNNIFRAIDKNDFELAIALYEEKIIQNNKFNKSFLYNLLKKLNIQIKQIEQGVINEHNVAVDNSIVESKENLSMEFINPSVKFTKIVKCLVEQDLDNLFLELRNYLTDINKIEYEFLIINLIKLSLLQHDLSFSKPLMALTYISKNNFKFVLSEYLQNFYEALAINSFEEAKIYLDIISKSSKLGQPCVIIGGLKQILTNTEKKLNYSHTNKVLTQVEKTLHSLQDSSKLGSSNLQTVPDVTLTVIGEKLSNIETPSVMTTIENPTPQPVESTPNQSSKTQDPRVVSLSQTNFNSKEFVDSKLEKVISKGILLLKTIPTERMQEIHNIVESLPDFVSFEVEIDNVKQICLRYRPQVSETLDIKEILRAGSKAYENKQYNDCINIYKELFSLDELKSFVYAKIGLAYMRKRDKSTAIDYLTVATDLNRRQNGQYDFTNLIYALKGQINQQEAKPYVRMSELDFENDMDNYYGIEDIEKIANLILEGTSIDEVSDIMGFDVEQKNIATLILARECYAQQNYTLGDQYLKIVEKTKDKSLFVKKLMKKIITNKKFYKNRIGENHKRLNLIKKHTPNSKK